jgi:hypothetical protein
MVFAWRNEVGFGIILSHLLWRGLLRVETRAPGIEKTAVL